MLQAQEYAKKLDVRFVYTSNGDGFLFYDMETGEQEKLSLDEFPAPQTLYDLQYKKQIAESKDLETIINTPYYFGEESFPPRYYQRIAINRTVEAIKGGFKIGGVQIPNYLWITVAVTIVMWIIWNKTKLGKNMFAVGTNQEAAAVSGVNVAKTIILVFALAGITYGISGFVESARIASNSTATGVNYELDAIAACVIGGVSFMGGIGKIRGVILGVFLLQIVNAGLVFLEFNPAAQTIVKGAIILFACAMDMRKYIAKK